jgi:hypothetical protein
MKNISSRSEKEFKNLEILLIFALILPPTKSIFNFLIWKGKSQCIPHHQ